MYTTLSRLERGGLVESERVAQDTFPDRRVCSLTDAGTEALFDWLVTPIDDLQLKQDLLAKILLHSLLDAGDPVAFIRRQRQRCLESLARLGSLRTGEGSEPLTALLLHGAGYHVEADLRWLDLCEARIADLKGGRAMSTTSGAPAPVVEAVGVRKVYGEDDTAVAALRGIDLAVAEGEKVAVMGPSGCGKSTLLHVLGAVETPSGGEVRYRGRPLSGMDDRELTAIRRDHIGFVFQAFNLVPVLSAEENVALPLIVAGERPRRHQARIDELLAELGLDDRRDKLPSQLSGGEQQRVAIARALLREPEVLLADEPTGSLDQAAGAAVLGLLRRIHERGQTIVLVTHDAKVASRNAVQLPRVRCCTCPRNPEPARGFGGESES